MTTFLSTIHTITIINLRQTMSYRQSSCCSSITTTYSIPYAAIISFAQIKPRRNNYNPRRIFRPVPSCPVPVAWAKATLHSRQSGSQPVNKPQHHTADSRSQQLKPIAEHKDMVVRHEWTRIARMSNHSQNQAQCRPTVSPER